MTAEIQSHFAEDLRGRHVQQFDNGLGVLQGLQRRVDFGVIAVKIFHLNAVALNPLVQLIIGCFLHVCTLLVM